MVCIIWRTITIQAVIDQNSKELCSISDNYTESACDKALFPVLFRLFREPDSDPLENPNG